MYINIHKTIYRRDDLFRVLHCFFLEDVYESE